MSDTPETDEQEFLRMSDDWRFVNVEFARKMERERDEALEKLNSHAPDGHNASNWQFFKVREERDQWRECAEKLATQMQRLADCDWVITLPDRMDAVRNIAHESLAEFDRLKEEGDSPEMPQGNINEQ